MIEATVGSAGFDGYLKLSAWASLLREGNYNALHAHPESAWSGVYYVDAGEPAGADELSGLLELRDPRPAVEMVPAPGWLDGRDFLPRAARNRTAAAIDVLATPVV